MVEGVTRRLRSRFVFVVGKGGVGKTTTAGALALGLAEGGEDVHLISTDPAHSLGDLFAADLSDGAPHASPCDERLVLEELDAEAYAARWVARGRAPVMELFDRGTYLDAEDIEGFLALTLPGVDEVAAALRLSELAETRAERVVVDTAPTGHALRLLDAERVLASWSRAFDAMGEKAVAVLERFARGPVRLDAEDFLEALERQVDVYRTIVLEEGEAVVVERSGVVVEAETSRLVGRIRSLGLRVAARVRTSEPGVVAGAGRRPCEPEAEESSTPPRYIVPYLEGLQGCDGLRRWGHDPEPAPASPAGGDAPAAGRTGDTGDPGAFLGSLPVELLVFVGKGGVGKTTCATAVALLRAAREPVTLLGTDPAGSLDDVLGQPSTEGSARADQDPSSPPLPGDLRVRQVRAEERFDSVRTRYRLEVETAFERLGLDRTAALDRRVVASFLDLAPPGIDELFALTALLEDVASGRTVVVDTAPTGHLLRLLSMPETALQWVRQLLRILLKYRALLGLDAFAEGLLEFARRLGDLQSRLSDPSRSAAVVVTQPGPLVAAETRRLFAGLDAAGIRVAAVVANRAPPAAGSGHLADGSDGAVPHGARLISAPARQEPPIGPDALRSFLRTWSFAG